MKVPQQVTRQNATTDQINGWMDALEQNTTTTTGIIASIEKL